MKKLFVILASAGLLVGCDQAGQGGSETDNSTSGSYGTATSPGTTSTDSGAYGSGTTSGAIRSDTNNIDTGVTSPTGSSGVPTTTTNAYSTDLGGQGANPDTNTNSGSLNPDTGANTTR